MPDQSALFKGNQCFQFSFQRTFRRPVHTMHTAQVDHFYSVEAKITQVIFYRARQFFGAKRRQPVGFVIPTRPNFSHDAQIGRIRVQRFFDYLVSDMRTIEVAGVDMINTSRHGVTKHLNRLRFVSRRPEHAGAGQLHCAIAKTTNFAVAKTISKRGLRHGIPPG